MYFNYHAKVKRLIKEGKVVSYKIVDKWNAISPALVIFFDSAPPMPIREEHWDEYLKLLENSQK